MFFFFFNDTATTEIYTLSLHDALPIYPLAISVAVATVPGRTDTATARLGLAGGGAILTAPFVLGAFADRVGIERAYGIVVPLLLAAVVLTLLAGRTDAR